MKVNAIVYTSATGFTRRHAQMLGERTGLPVHDLRGGIPPVRGTRVLYLGWLFAGGVKDLARARRKWNVRGVCAVGMSPEEMARDAGIGERLGNTPLFYLRGGYSPEKLPGIYRPMMWMMTKKVTKEPPKDEKEAYMHQVFREGADFVDEKYLEPVLAWLADSTGKGGSGHGHVGTEFDGKL